MNIYERIKKFLNYNGNEPIADIWDTVDAFEPIDNYRWYKIALVWTKVRNIVAIVVDSDEDAVKLEQSEDFIKWICSWVEVKI